MGKEIVALRIKGKGSVFHDVPVPPRLSAGLLEWKDMQESFKARRIMASGGIALRDRSLCWGVFGGAQEFSKRSRAELHNRIPKVRTRTRKHRCCCFLRRKRAYNNKIIIVI